MQHGRDGAAARSDFDGARVLDVPMQVQRLIAEATSSLNLSQSYIGWCPFW
jgi:FKBP12-rapamycin complex-associated protein